LYRQQAAAKLFHVPHVACRPVAFIVKLEPALSCAAKNTIIMGGLRMNWTAVACIALVAGCANSPAPENESAPGAGRPGVDQRREARALEQAETDCASQGKRAVARREEGETFYDCVDK
jgi:hypothetical protein